MTFKTINHIAIAVQDLEKSKQFYAGITGASAGETIDVPDQLVLVCFLETGKTRIELISPMPGNKDVNKFLERRGEGLHHICFGVQDIETTLADLVSKGMRLIDKTPRAGAEGHKIAFIHPESTGGVLIELEEI